MLLDLVKKNRSYRRFFQDVAISRDELKGFVNLARLSASAANRQPLKYFLSADRETNTLIFRSLAWAAYLKDWPGPSEGERPSAYIVIFGDTSIAKDFWCDHGIAAQSILLGATEKGFGGCILAAIDRKGLIEALRIPGHLEILLVIALGKPREEIRIEELPADGDIRYWRDAGGVHHVPKRPLEEIVLEGF